jgi:hypothetical protein
MVEGSCHCGAVRFRLREAPTEVTECNCSVCRRLGVLWAYVPADSVEIAADPATDTYAWGARTQAFHRCRVCGCTTHWAKFDPDFDTVGVNARLLAPEVLAAARLRHLDGALSDTYLD